MNGRKSTYLFCILTCPLFCSAQSDFGDSLKNKIGFGGMYYHSYDYDLIASYSRILKRENEICLSFYYNNYSSAQEIIGGVGFYYSIFKKPSKFDLLLVAEINYSRYWYYDIYKDKTVSRYGPFLYLGFIPAYNFSKRFSVSLETKIGWGYQWGKNDEYYDYQAGQIRYSQTGSYLKVLGGLKLNYKF